MYTCDHETLLAHVIFTTQPNSQGRGRKLPINARMLLTTSLMKPPGRKMMVFLNQKLKFNVGTKK